jgi:hypothetical protein
VYKGKEKERRQKESGIEKVVRAASSIGRFWLLDECRVLFSFPAVVWVFYSAVDQNHAVDQHARRWKGKKKRTLLSAFDLALFLTSAWVPATETSMEAIHHFGQYLPSGPVRGSFTNWPWLQFPAESCGFLGLVIDGRKRMDPEVWWTPPLDERKNK